MNLRKMNDSPYSGCFLTFEAGRIGKILGQLYSKKEASESFSAMDWQFERREIALLSLGESKLSINALVLMDRMHGSGGTGKLKMRLWMPVMLDKPITTDEIDDKFSFEQWICSAETFKRIPHKEWLSVLTAIKLLRPESVSQIDNLIMLREQRNLLTGDDQKILRLTEQRDALGLVLDVASLDRKTILREADFTKVNEAKSVLDLLDAQPLQEQDLIRSDEAVFKNLLKSKDCHCQRFNGAGNREVRVYVADKKSLETVLGIDLLIYLDDFKTFVLLQYKCMEPKSDDEGKTWSYLVDAQIKKQIRAMDEAVSSIASLSALPATSINDWRLNDEAFYFKFCETTRPDARDDALVAGITLSHSHFKHFLTLSESNGQYGGKRIGYGNCPRYLNNTQFIDLVREGWIGCDSRGYALISKVLDSSNESGRSAMYAVIKGSAAKTAADRGRRPR